MTRHQRGHVHETLRRATAPAHHALDHHRLMQRLTSRDLTREQYAESLAAMYRPHARLERQVHASRHHGESGLELSPRIERLAADLSDLGRPAPRVSRTAVPDSDERAAWWGRVYVLEGSRQGGAVIARCVLSVLGDTVPCRFFAEPIPADDLPGDSRALMARLENELEDHVALEQAVESARAAFAAYQVELDSFDTD